MSLYGKVSYDDIVEPWLRISDGDPTELLEKYPHFNPKGIVTESLLCYPYLHYACSQNHLHAAQGLVRCGANLLQKDRDGCLPLEHACAGSEPSRKELVKWILSIEPSQDLISSIVQVYLHDNVTLLRLFLQYNLDLNLIIGLNSRKLLNKCGFYLNFAQGMENIGQWRPWTHTRYPSAYRDAMSTLVLIAKIKKQ